MKYLAHKLTSCEIFFAFFVLFSLLILRSSLLEYTDLIDPTESRYATVAQEMYLSNDWVTPKLPMPEGVVPYLGKPPLHFWLTALSYKLFGVDEWSARFPSFFATLLVILFTLIFCGKFLSNKIGVYASIVGFTSPLLFFLSGSSLVDVTLTATSSGTMTFFALFLYESEKSRRRSMFLIMTSLFLSLGFLTKGPVVIAITLFALIPWMLFTRKYKLLQMRDLYLAGAAFFVFSAPWFFVSEYQNPGFLKYFFWNENIARYLFHDYGDKYGSGHRFPRGTVWGMLFLSFLPWVVYSMRFFNVKFVKILMEKRKEPNPWLVYVIFWALAPLIFFTFVRQLHTAYVLPSIPFFAILIATMVASVSEKILGNDGLQRWNRLYVLVVFFLSLLLCTIGYFVKAEFISIILSGALLVAFGFLIFESRLPKIQKFSFPSLGAALASCFAAVIISWTPHINERKSSEGLLRKISLNNNVGNNMKIGVITSNTFSHYWISQAGSREIAKPLDIDYVKPEEIVSKGFQSIILKKGTEEEIPPELLSHFEKVDQVGRWQWYKLKSSL
jgi:4-amino-4-deoxy-L-arabinose transferase-like glycosyltransferase